MTFPSFTIALAARAEAVESYGLDFAECILARFDVKDIYAPICGNPITGEVYLDAARARHVWPDMLEAVG